MAILFIFPSKKFLPISLKIQLLQYLQVKMLKTLNVKVSTVCEVSYPALPYALVNIVYVKNKCVNLNFKLLKEIYCKNLKITITIKKVILLAEWSCCSPFHFIIFTIINLPAAQSPSANNRLVRLCPAILWKAMRSISVTQFEERLRETIGRLSFWLC